MDENVVPILAEYDHVGALYKQFAERCGSLIGELLAANGYRVHSVSSRLKGRDELEEKIQREGKSYKKLSDLTDVAGVRVITHFEDEVDRIGTLIESEFAIDGARSIDKRKTLDPDRFGYLSLHYICGLHADRLKLSENRRYSGLLCEVQIRSILQHAWAEIEHDLGYKSENTVPAPVRRRFYRLAGLLEVADQEFKSIRDELKTYASTVAQDIRSKPGEIEIDDVSVEALVRNDHLCSEVDEEMARRVQLNLVASPTFDPQRLADQLRYCGLTKVSDARRELDENKRIIPCQFAIRVAGTTVPKRPINRGLCLFHLVQVLVAKSGESALVAYLGKFGYKEGDKSLEQLARDIISAVKACS